MVQLLLEGARATLEWIAGLIYQGLIDPVLTDGSFRAGLAWGIVLAGVFGWVGIQVGAFRAEVDRFFNATKTPATNAGPKPSQLGVGCIVAYFKLFVVFVLLVIVAMAVVRAIGVAVQ